jgi:hypothetical protein
MQYALAQAPLKARKLGCGAKPQFPKEEQCLFDEICENVGMDIQSPAVKFKLRCVNLSANIVSEHLLAGYMDFCIDTNLHRELALRRSIKSILACKVAMM